jgi:hypothetical protein
VILPVDGDLLVLRRCVVAVATAAPHSLQNFEFGGSSVPHDPHTEADTVMSRGQPTVVPTEWLGVARLKGRGRATVPGVSLKKVSLQCRACGQVVDGRASGIGCCRALGPLGVGRLSADCGVARPVALFGPVGCAWWAAGPDSADV